MLANEMSAEQARRNMESTIHGPGEAVECLDEAIRTASIEHRSDTTVFLSRAHIDNADLARIVSHYQKLGFKVEDRCHDRERFALHISWYST